LSKYEDNGGKEADFKNAVFKGLWNEAQAGNFVYYLGEGSMGDHWRGWHPLTWNGVSQNIYKANDNSWDTVNDNGIKDHYVMDDE
jgi:hypothetical protein